MTNRIDLYSKRVEIMQYHHDGAIIFHFLISDLTLSAHMQSSGTPATSMKAAILAGLGIAASILLL